MTQDQKNLFVAIAQMGIICGLTHPFEWYVNYMRSLQIIYTDVKLPQKQKEATECFLEFYKETKCSEDDPVINWTEQDLDNAICQFYKKK